MKKLSLSLAAILCSFVGFAQEAETEDGELSLQIIPRFEIAPVIPLSGDVQGGFNFRNPDFYGNSSLYTLFEGDIAPWLSFSVANHWLSAYPKELYTNTWRAWEANWCDWANLTFHLGEKFHIVVGKDALAVGTREIDAYDFDSHYPLMSQMWHNLQAYQWGGSLDFTPVENVIVRAQVTSSPFCEKPFQDGLMTYTIYGAWNRDAEDGVSLMASLNMLQFDKKDFIWMPNLSVRYTGEDYYFGLDASSRFASTQYYDVELFDVIGADPVREATLVLSASYDLEDCWNILLKAGWEPSRGLVPVMNYGCDFDEETWLAPIPEHVQKAMKNGFFGGVGVQYYPFGEQDDRSLRVHAVLGASNYARSLTANVGVTWFFEPLKLFKK